ncbi:alpha/beta-Hydrolases superfamily protein [Zea mays]|uniref:Alpha/beta-Hydrolases superfamily protein n=1 Tax=Zea mays TaxID=4577 RepID=A0A1D6NS74_MAIZE|nr:alpha/beta-Hydrolases superfamily protein [Zea mays]AQL01114.1 alpha/beta-Hydrolases superfamily protein [Zea mays]
MICLIGYLFVPVHFIFLQKGSMVEFLVNSNVHECFMIFFEDLLQCLLLCREIKEKICVAGGDPTIVESPTEPKWSSKGELFFITDRRSGFWNIYKWDEHSRAVTPLHSLDAEFSKPMWIFGVSSYGFLGIDDTSHKIVCSYRFSHFLIAV